MLFKTITVGFGGIRQIGECAIAARVSCHRCCRLLRCELQSGDVLIWRQHGEMSSAPSIPRIRWLQVALAIKAFLTAPGVVTASKWCPSWFPGVNKRNPSAKEEKQRSIIHLKYHSSHSSARGMMQEERHNLIWYSEKINFGTRPSDIIQVAETTSLPIFIFKEMTCTSRLQRLTPRLVSPRILASKFMKHYDISGYSKRPS